MRLLHTGKLGFGVAGPSTCLAAIALALAIAAPAQASSGAFERTWGMDVVAGGGTGFEICTAAASCKTGTVGGLGGEFNPNGVATDGAGNVYVADFSNNRIQKFDSSGNFLRAWGKDVVAGGGTGFEICTAAGSCKAGASGGLGGEFNGPGADGVAADAAGNVYVADFFNRRIQKFDSSGSFLRAWGKDVVAGGGTGFEICTVAASCKAGLLSGGLGGELEPPGGVAADAAGSVYVADRFNHRIQKFDSSGSFQRAWGKDVVAGGGTGFEICTVAGSCKAGAIGGLGGELNLPIGAATDAAGSVYVADTFNNRIQKFRGGTFEIVGLVGRILTLTVPGAGEIEVTDAAARRVSAAAKKKLLKPASATASGPGAVKVKLKLTKPAKKKLKRKGKVKVKAAITYTPTGGSAYTETAKLKVKKKK